MRAQASWFVFLAGCAVRASLPVVRFANAPIVGAVDDRRDVARPPARRSYDRELYFFDASFTQPLVRALELRPRRRAEGVNALDEVPDSTWFTNRIGVRALTPDEIRTGPTGADPELHTPWSVRSTKIGGTSLGYIIKDTTGAKYMIKFEGADDPPEEETGTHVAVNRLLWACGYNVADDHVVYLRPGDLVLAADAVVKDADGNTKRPLERAELDRGLATVRHEPDGRIRAMASRWIEGTTLGGHPGEGVRADDPNDTIAHELRRDLRGQASIYAWLDAVDVTEGQYVDSWTADPMYRERHYLKHYAIDFGKSLGVMGSADRNWWHGSGYLIDLAQIGRSFITLGLSRRPWEERTAPTIRGVSSLFESEVYDPGAWHPDLAGYAPFITADRFDKFWGAAIVARFSRAQIRAAVEAGRFTDPRAIEYLTDTLVKRQRVTLAYWFARVNPLDHFAMSPSHDGHELCFDDLAIGAQLASAAVTHYAITAYDYRGLQLGPAIDVAAAGDGHTCTAHAPAAPAGDDGGYTILRIATVRASFAGETFVHQSRDAARGVLRIIGVWRT